MASGGFRVGAGRPAGVTTGNASGRKILKKMKMKEVTSLAIVPPPDLGEGITPLQYMLSIVRDSSAEKERRDRMAIAAAPFCHPRISDMKIGKKDRIKAAVAAAEKDEEWGDDLHIPSRPRAGQVDYQEKN